MEGINLEIIILLLVALSFGSSLIHYSTYARAKARLKVKKEKSLY